MVLHSPAISDEQRSDMRDAFYGGARAFMTALDEVTDNPAVTIDDVEVLADLDAELHAFGKFIEERARRAAARAKKAEGS